MVTLKEIEQALSQCLTTLPNQIGTEAVNFAKQRFVSQNWHDTTAEPWQPRKRNRRGGKKRQKGAILVDSGRLKRSIRIVSTTTATVTIGTDVAYAQIHNDGCNALQTVRAHTRKAKGRTQKVGGFIRHMKMPRRRFLGDSAELTRLLTEFITNELNFAINEKGI